METNGSIARVGGVGEIMVGVVGVVGVVSVGQAAHKGTSNATNVNAITPKITFFFTIFPLLSKPLSRVMSS